MFDIHINFGYRTFQWTSAARGKAAVHCVIVGFSHNSIKTKKLIFEGEVETEAVNINPYLLDSPNIFIESRSKPLCNVPEIQKGNIPVDGGNLIIETEDYDDFIVKKPKAEKYIRRLVGADEYINNKKRYCLWLLNVPPNELKQMPEVMKRVESCRKFRLNSTQKRQQENMPIFQLVLWKFGSLIQIIF